MTFVTFADPLGELYGALGLVKSLCSRAVFFNLGSAEPRGSANFLLGSLKILKIVLYGAFRAMIPNKGAEAYKVAMSLCHGCCQ